MSFDPFCERKWAFLLVGPLSKINNHSQTEILHVLTGNFQIHADSPVSISFWTINIQISKAYFAYTLNNSPGFISRNANFVVRIVGGRIKGVNKFGVRVFQWCSGSFAAIWEGSKIIQ